MKTMVVMLSKFLRPKHWHQEQDEWQRAFLSFRTMCPSLTLRSYLNNRFTLNQQPWKVEKTKVIPGHTPKIPPNLSRTYSSHSDESETNSDSFHRSKEQSVVHFCL
jgi:hypothetical protein